MDNSIVGKLTLVVFLCTIMVSFSPTHAATAADVSEQTQACVACHAVQTAGIHQGWRASRHYEANVGCFECHRAEEGDTDLMKHNGFGISIIVSPKDCARCHSKEVQEFDESHHAKAGLILGSLDNFLADIVEGDWEFYGGSALTASGCAQCHGSLIEVEEGGSLSPASWPNTGMGRVNPDGSIGSCTACHQRHEFSSAQARRPENCGKCHLGPDHPQKEIYEESKHGIAFQAHVDDLNLDSPTWVLGEDYTAAATCATCHMSAVRTSDGELMPLTHDVGMRISWNNRPAKSIRPEISDRKLGLQKMAGIDWEVRRANMKKVCTVCHAPGYVDNFYEQYDGVINLYNSKFAEPGIRLMNILYDNKLVTATRFDEEVEWIWWEIWHHEGRVARHGASMMAPDYTHWHGLYEVAKHWYAKFIPELRGIVKINLASRDVDRSRGARELDTAIDEMLDRPEHSWYTGRLPKEEQEKREKAMDEFRERYRRE
jgi:hypothetical protein